MASWISTARAALLAATLLLTACATTPKFEAGRLASHPEQLDHLYIYSFLDVMDDKFGRKFLDEVRRQLDVALDAEQVRHQQLWFKDPGSLPRTALVTQRTQVNPFRGAHESTSVPVAETLAANRVREQEYGAAYRLIVFPSSTAETGTGMKHTIRWVLSDALLDRPVWDTTSEIEMVLWWGPNENAEKRAQVFVDGLIAEWRKIGFLARRPAPAPR